MGLGEPPVIFSSPCNRPITLHYFLFGFSGSPNNKNSILPLKNGQKSLMFPFLSEFEGRFAQTSVLALDLSGFTGVELQRPLSTEGLRPFRYLKLVYPHSCRDLCRRRGYDKNGLVIDIGRGLQRPLSTEGLRRDTYLVSLSPKVAETSVDGGVTTVGFFHQLSVLLQRPLSTEGLRLPTFAEAGLHRLQRPLSTEGLRLQDAATSSRHFVAETSVDGGVTTHHRDMPRLPLLQRPLSTEGLRLSSIIIVFAISLQRPLSTEGLRLFWFCRPNRTLVAETSVDGGVTTLPNSQWNLPFCCRDLCRRRGYDKKAALDQHWSGCRNLFPRHCRLHSRRESHCRTHGKNSRVHGRSGL